MAMAPRDDAQHRDANINLRAPAQIKELIERAARLLGKSRSEFMLDAARKCAQEVLLDQRSFRLDKTRHAALVKILSEPRRPTAALRKLLADTSPWEK
jgi:uncharacterized protein (DUF1778 family)